MHLQAEIVMQVAGSMLLDHEPATAALAARLRDRGSWLGRAGKITFLAVRFQTARRAPADALELR